jgi:predicted nucleotidyltransferase
MGQLIELLGKTKSFLILELFLDYPTRTFSLKELKNTTKLAKNTIIKWLTHFTKVGFIEEQKNNFYRLFKLNNENIIIKEFKKINTISKLKELKELSKKYNILIYLYGSSARGEDIEKSDIDLLIIGKIKKQNIIKEMKKVENTINKEIKFQIFSQLEWSNMIKKDKAFYERVEKDKIEVSK